MLCILSEAEWIVPHVIAFVKSQVCYGTVYDILSWCIGLGMFTLKIMISFSLYAMLRLVGGLS